MIVRDSLMVQLKLSIYSLLFKFSSLLRGLLEKYISHNTKAILRPTFSSLFLAEKSSVSVMLVVFFTK